MRKSAFAALLLLAAVPVGAQTLSDALTFSENNYYGTARSIGLGNAVTALGGDLGTIGINPAGSAVAGYSQFTITPGLSLLGNNAGYSTSDRNDYSNWNTTDRTKFVMPNIASSIVFETNQPNGLKSMTFAFAANTTSQYLNDFTGYGRNDFTSQLGSFAAGAAGYAPYDFASGYNGHPYGSSYDPYFDSTIPWNYIMAYNSGMMVEAYDEFGNPILDEFGNNTYLGTTEGLSRREDGSYDIRIMGPLDQEARVESYGSKTDFIMNMGFNFSDRFYLGFNLGLPFATYNYNEYFREAAVDPYDFPLEFVDGETTNFSHASYQYSQTSDISGIYAKVGAIWLPFQNLRLGAAIQTPTLYTVNDSWCVDGYTNFANLLYNTSELSPMNDYMYNLSTPWRFNFGAAWTFGGRGLVSADLDLTDYSSMKFSEYDRYNSNYFDFENRINRNFAGLEYYGRFGAEYRVIPEIAVRLGYTFKTSPQYYRFDSYGDRYDASTYAFYYDEFESGRNTLVGREAFPDVVRSYSLGFGYSSDGSFFADVAFRLTKYPVAYYNPYSDYVTGGADYLPEVSNSRNITDMVFTFGWRF